MKSVVAQGMCDVDSDCIHVGMRIPFIHHILFFSLWCSCRVWPSLHRLSIRSLSFPAVRCRRPHERRYDELEGSQQRRLYSQSRRCSWGNLGLGGDPQVSHNTTAEAVRYHVTSLCLGGGFLVAWWGDLWCLVPRWRLSFAW